LRTRSLAWLGIATEQYTQMVGFFRDTMGLRVEFAGPTSTELSLPDQSRVQVFAPEDPYYDFFTQHGHGPVPLFEIDDVERACEELRANGLEVIGEPHSDGAWTWIDVRGPDGNLYELAARRS
jgi:catechol 2,3-dioxygenase-like lactoylglutathione lyase family enzyme